jgi:hypothetical protein
MKSRNSRCLLLNADYMPLSIIDWKKALTWMIRYENNNKYGIDIIDFYKDDCISGTNNKKYPIPAVARTKRYFHIKDSALIFSRKNIFLRDEYKCQYCNKLFENKYLTYDHVIPKSKWNYSMGSPTTWTNIVTACVDCNRKKGNRSPQQANMVLIKAPIKPNKSHRYSPIAHYLRKINYIPKEWIIYLPPSYA